VCHGPWCLRQYSWKKQVKKTRHIFANTIVPIVTGWRKPYQQ
jgi:hypothetical protein